MKKPKQKKKPSKQRSPGKLARELMHNLSAAAPKVAPACRHFGTCGGCELQDLAYDEQLKTKRAVFEKMINVAELREFFASAPLETVPSPQPFAYRQRMDFVFAFGEAGLRLRGSYTRVVELFECHLIAPPAFAAFRRTIELARALEIPSYDYLKHEGCLRYVITRYARNGSVLVALVTKSDAPDPRIERIAETLLAENRAQSVHWLVQPTLADMSFGTPVRFWGREHIEESLLGLRLLLGPQNFFQANPAVAERAYALLAEYGRASGLHEALDLYAGAGAIGYTLARDFRLVTAVESEPANLEMAARNAELNAILNVEFVKSDAAAWLESAVPREVYIAVNPPRLGLGPKASAQLARLNAPALGYMSCNPATLLEDLRTLRHSYRLEAAHLLDMFPQTRHFETVLLLRRG